MVYFWKLRLQSYYFPNMLPVYREMCLRIRLSLYLCKKSLFMIQRKQTLFLILAAIALLALYFFPVASFWSEQAYYKFFIYKLELQGPLEADIFRKNLVMPLGIFNGIIILVIFISIFLFKKRRQQMRLVKLSILMNVILVGLIFFVYASLIGKTLNTSADYSGDVGIYLPLICLIMLILANRGILNDEKLVRSVDRLR
ncbi:MAG TPA: hypothetical protein DCL86_10605 [Bacteroidales bacterium]|nr:hypothetical protein [Bacteroidales bacterium]